METKHLVVISAGLSQPSSTRMLGDRLAEATKQDLTEDACEVVVDVIELRDLAHDIVNNLLTGFPAPALESAIEKVATADGLIVVSPIFNASYSGLFKSFFDALDNSMLTGKPVLIAATGGTPRHSLALEHAMRPLFVYLHAHVVTTSVFAATSDWGSDGDSEGELVLRIGRAARELSDLMSRYTAPAPSATDFGGFEGFAGFSPETFGGAQGARPAATRAGRPPAQQTPR